MGWELSFLVCIDCPESSGLTLNLLSFFSSPLPQKEKISMLKGKRHRRKTEFVLCEMCRFCCGVLIHLSLEKWDGMQSSGLSSMTTAVNPQVPQAPLWAWAPVQHHTWTAPSLPQLDTLQACVYGRREDRELKAHLSPFKPSKIHNFGVCLAKK